LSDKIFYAAAEGQKPPHGITGYVPSKFLVRSGTYVADPVPGAWQNANLYSDSLGNNQTDGKIANPNNYIVVPANYSEQDAKDFGNRLGVLQRISPPAMLGVMTSAFWPGGSEELQRNPRWGIPANSFVRAYISSASNHFGYVTGAAGLPRGLAEVGGGLHNQFSKALLKPDVDVEGKAGVSKVNEANIAQGYAAGLAANTPPERFNDYGYNSQPDASTDQIGDGKGVAPLSEMMLGVNPGEPEPPAWPPQQPAQVRYLGTTVRYWPPTSHSLRATECSSRTER
jgi:hypothetical protein